MNIILLIVHFLSVITYCILEGVREGIYYHYKNQTLDYNKNLGEHKLFTIQRAMFYLLSAVLAFYLTDDVFVGIAYISGTISIFPFLHDNAYYFQRNKMDPSVYSLELNNFSMESTAYSDKKKIFTPKNRNILFGCGIAVIITSIVLTYLKI